MGVPRMTEFLIELYVSKANCAELAVTVARFCHVAAEVTAEGKSVRLVRSIFVPDEETCLLLVEASTVEDVRDTARRAALPFEHVVATADDINHSYHERTTSS
jgi:hypothetical protein